jgi:hypothetical protein
MTAEQTWPSEQELRDAEEGKMGILLGWRVNGQGKRGADGERGRNYFLPCSGCEEEESYQEGT